MGCSNTEVAVAGHLVDNLITVYWRLNEASTGEERDEPKENGENELHICAFEVGYRYKKGRARIGSKANRGFQQQVLSIRFRSPLPGDVVMPTSDDRKPNKRNRERNDEAML